MILYKQFTFDAAHFLTKVPKNHKCKQLHGHTYHLTVFVEGEVKEEEGWVIDFYDLKSAVNPVLNQLDHQLLNDVEGLSNPTSELLAIWIWRKIKPVIPQLKKIELKETPTSGVIYTGE
ncbi:6-carboxytetrahydropterin synthase QueD [Desertivirga xinjiangensis]|uniref:6-carboxytetrahydropterin synthase QueD n=1 Tax=Desertivirga xinjiangensis TaxID=539206 RepID=UPI00210E0B84|nr:6-carboxytetrahydropterin synthase QueD [Pedobacter xinjiangensis]